MSTLFVIVALPFIHWFYHPVVLERGHCLAEPGSYHALLCPPGSGTKGPWKYHL